MLGVFAVSVGTLMLLLGAMNRARQAGNNVTTRHLQWLLLYVGGLMVVFQMFFRMEYTWDVSLHGALAYQTMAIGMPTMFAVLWVSSRNRWACTWSAAIYTVFVIGAILILPCSRPSPSWDRCITWLPASSAQVPRPAAGPGLLSGPAVDARADLETVADRPDHRPRLRAAPGRGGVALCQLPDDARSRQPLLRDHLLRLQHAAYLVRRDAQVLEPGARRDVVGRAAAGHALCLVEHVARRQAGKVDA